MTLLIFIKWELLFIFYIKFKQHTKSYDTWYMYKQQTLAWLFLQSLLREAIVYFHFKKNKKRSYIYDSSSECQQWENYWYLQHVETYSQFEIICLSYTDLKEKLLKCFCDQNFLKFFYQIRWKWKLTNFSQKSFKKDLSRR